MLSTFRAKLLTLVGIFAVTFILNTLVTNIMSQLAQSKMTTLQEVYLPKMALGSSLSNTFKEIQRNSQDSVSASDLDILNHNLKLKESFLNDLSESGTLGSPADIGNLRDAFSEYFLTSQDLSKKMIEGDNGKDILELTIKMQRLQTKVDNLILEITSVDKEQVEKSFQSAKEIQLNLILLTISLSLIFLSLALGVYFKLSRGMIRSMSSLTNGLRNFSNGNFNQPIEIISQDEFGETSRLANELAITINDLLLKQENTLWLKSGLNGLSQTLQGELALSEISRQLIRYLTSYIGVKLGALYYHREQSLFRMEEPMNSELPAPVCKIGEGLLGQAALQTELVIIENTSDSMAAIESGIGQIKPREILILPLYHLGKLTGVLELGFFKESTPQQKEFLKIIASTIAVTIDVALARNKVADLLKKTQAQASQLMLQETELLKKNEELEAQQVELEQSNYGLEEQQRLLESEKFKLENLMVELETSRDEVLEKAKEAEQANLYKSQFLSNMSHELRTPLNIIMLLAQVLQENRDNHLDEHEIKNAKAIYSAGSDLLTLINDILDLAKIESGKMEFEGSLVNIKDIADQFDWIFKQQSEQKGIQFLTQLTPSAPPNIITDQKRFVQILKNLISNAIKFTKDGTVEICFDEFADSEKTPQEISKRPVLKVTVKDSGIGIAEDKKHIIFEAFQQADSSIDRRYSGTGLGLSISQNLAKNLGGYIYVESTLGIGSVFTLLLPEMSETHHTEVTSSQFLDNKSLQSEIKNAPILIVEDDEVFINLLNEKCKEFSFTCKLVRDAESALEFLEKQIPRAIILDIRLPKMDGIEFLKILRANIKWKNIPVHIVSVESHETETKNYHIDSHLQKPVSLTDLNQVLIKIGGKMQELKSGILLVGITDSNAAQLQQHFLKEKVPIEIVKNLEEAEILLKKTKFGCIVLGTDTNRAKDFINFMKQDEILNQVPVVFSTENSLDDNLSNELLKVSNSVIVRGDHTSKRLVDEINIFLHRVEDRLSDSEKAIRAKKLADNRLSGKKVLVVDDDVRNIFALRQVLLPMGINMVSAGNGLEAIDLLEADSEINLVLMDIMMPVMGGIEAIQKIRSHSKWKSIPIIAATAKAMKKDRDECLAAGANDYISKPINMDDLVQLMKIWISHAAK